MKTIEKMFTVTVTEEEVRRIMIACHAVYMAHRESDDSENLEMAVECRALRNEFGSLIGSRYMGADA